MLILPDDWRQCTAESSARAMLRQANEIGEYRVAARLLTRACFELLRDTLWGDVHDGGPVIHFEEQVIRVNDYAYLVADADDSAIDQAMALSERVHEVCVLTPPDVRVLMGEAMKSLQRKNVTVQSLDSYVGLRVMLTELDTRANGPAVFADLLLRYANLCERFGETRVEVTRDGLRPLSREQVEQSRRRSAERRLANDLGPVAKATSAPGTSRAASVRVGKDHASAHAASCAIRISATRSGVSSCSRRAARRH